MSAIARIAEFVVKTRLDDCPRDAIASVRRAALDSIGVMLAGSTEPIARIVREVARAEGGTPLCTVVGASLRTSPTWAALANGAAGHAARNAVPAAFAAREGRTAPESALDGKQGFLVATGTAPVPAAALATALDGLGQRWHVLETGVAVKPYPSCALTHSAIDALLDLRTRHGFAADQVAGIEVGVNHVVPSVLIHPAPTTALERKFSMQFCAAAAAAEGRVDLASFERPIPEPVGSLMARVTMVVDPALPDRMEQHAWSRVTVRLRDGRTLDSPARGATGHHDQPLTAEALRAKFLACCEGTLSPGDAAGIAEQLEHLEAIPDIRALTSRLVADRD